MAYTTTYLVDVSGLAFDENSDSVWVHALPVGDFNHPIYGPIKVSVDRAKKFAESVIKKVRGIDLSINYVHNNNEGAAGWVRNAEARDNGLWLFVEFVKDAAQQIREKKWKYFSAELTDEWTNPEGKKFADVILGGALTNRPWMKNLLPINLSETVYENAFEIVSLVSGTPIDSLRGGNNVPLTDEDLDKLVTKLAEKLTPTKPPTTEPDLTILTDNADLLALAEENPLVKALIGAVEVQRANIATSEKKLRDQEIATKLSEFDRSKIVLSPVARQQVLNLLEKIPSASHSDFWALMEQMRKSSTFLVEIGERAGATVNYGSPKSAIKQFDEMAEKIRTERKINATDAYEAAAAENPDLYKQYRTETMSGSAVR
jgi:Mu-like prophage I protein